MRAKDHVKIDAHLRAWERAVAVQEHFNDIGWRIRALGVTILTFTLGGTGVVYANSERISIFDIGISPATLVPIVGLVIWGALAFMDAGWFHRLLIGAVLEASMHEKLLTELGVPVSLGANISSQSPIKFFKPQSFAARRAKRPKVQLKWPTGNPAQIHSRHKLKLYYGSIALLLLAAAAAVGFYSSLDANLLNGGGVSLVQ